MVAEKIAVKRHIYDHVFTDSDTERRFVEGLDTGAGVEVYAKLPQGFFIPTPVGNDEILGTILFSVLSGHRRYAHITAIRGDKVLAELLGIEQFRSEASVRRALEKLDEMALTGWLMELSFGALLEQPWILDLDATVKTLYGKQEEARIGYNPAKPCRPSHAYHGMLLAAARLVLDVDVYAGNLTASTYAPPTLWGWLEARDRKYWPALVRGDIAHANEEMMAGCEQRGLQVCVPAAADER